MTEAAFLLGGIGTGNVTVGIRGELRDWELFNAPGVGQKIKHTYFAIHARKQGCASISKVLESNLKPPYTVSHGFLPDSQLGLPRFENSKMHVEYPFVQVDLYDHAMPMDVRLTAFTPFVPLNSDDSGIPACVLRYTLTNTSDTPVFASIAGSLLNATGFVHLFDEPFDYLTPSYEVINEWRDTSTARGLFYRPGSDISGKINDGTMALMTRDSCVTQKKDWLDGGWWDGAQEFWDDFSTDGLLQEAANSLNSSEISMNHIDYKVGSMAIHAEIQPGQSKDYEFILAWHFPNRPKGWCLPDCANKDTQPTVRNYFSTLWPDAWQAGTYLLNNLVRLEGDSRKFADAFYGSTLPPEVLDAASANITVFRSTTCFRLEDGTLMGWEGSWDRRGSCPGSCTHVWNYAQTMAFLFPELEKTMRAVEFGIETDDEGRMAFRAYQIFGRSKQNFHPATDGQLGCVVRFYRDWMLTGDNEFLRKYWKRVKASLDFAFTFWDSDGDYLLDNQQHNTYDIEFYGPNSMINTIFFAALKAGERMASFLGDSDASEKYANAFTKGSELMDSTLWNGEYYIQRLDDVDAHRYQVGSGCLSDQIVGQYFAHVAGLGYVIPAEHSFSAVKSIYNYNFISDVGKLENVQRVFALQGESGLVLCTWPHGGRPKLPMIYSDEVWTGVEYQVAATLIYEGLVEEGLKIIRAVRARYDGTKRNPWNEVECGNHYVRSMSSWAVYLAITGFKYNLVEGNISFSPKYSQDDFKCFFSHGKAWGIYSQKKLPDGSLQKHVEVLGGSMEGIMLG